MSAWTAAVRRSFEERWDLGPVWSQELAEDPEDSEKKRHREPKAKEQNRRHRMTDVLIVREMMDGKYYLKKIEVIRGERTVTWTTDIEEARIFGSKAEAISYAVDNEVRPPYKAITRKKASEA